MSKKNKSNHVKLISNPGAGKATESAKNLKLVTGGLEKLGIIADVALAEPKEEATSIARQAVKDGYKTVIAMGGDGTISAVIRGMAGSKVRLGIIAAGTENDFAASLGIPKDLKEACALIASAHTRNLDLGQIRTTKKKKFYFFMTIAIGLTATIFPLVKKFPEGKYATVMDALTTFLKFESKPKVFLTLDDESKIEVETMVVAILNTPMAGIKNLVAPEASLEDGRLDISVYPGFNKAELLQYFFETAHEGSIPDGTIQRYQARKLKVKTSPKLDITADGILLGKGKAWIKVLPGALRVIAPEPGTGVEKPLDKAAKKLPEPVSSMTQ